MNKILNVYKPIGLTSYDVVRVLKKKYPGEKVGHAGTLDPLADGVLICLVGDATKQQTVFMDMKKEYIFEVLFGFKTDTFDVLGLVEHFDSYNYKHILSEIKCSLNRFQGKIQQKVPIFSATKVNGKPLYRWYLDGKIGQVKIPVKSVYVESLDMVKSATLSQDELMNLIEDLIHRVKRGFRQKEVFKSWISSLPSFYSDQKVVLVVTLKACVSRGTYVRAIANELGMMLGISACTLKITRTKVGNFQIKDAIRLESL